MHLFGINIFCSSSHEISSGWGLAFSLLFYIADDGFRLPSESIGYTHINAYMEINTNASEFRVIARRLQDGYNF